MLKLVHITHCLHRIKYPTRASVQFLRFNYIGDISNNKKDNFSKKDDLKIDLDELNRKLEESLNESKAGKITEVDKTFMNFSTQRNVIVFICKM